MQNANLYKCKLCQTNFKPRKTGGSEKKSFTNIAQSMKSSVNSPVSTKLFKIYSL